MQITHARNSVTAADLTVDLNMGAVTQALAPIQQALSGQNGNVPLSTIQDIMNKLQNFVNQKSSCVQVQAIQSQVGAALTAFENSVVMTTTFHQDYVGTRTYDLKTKDANGNYVPLTFATFNQNNEAASWYRTDDYFQFNTCPANERAGLACQVPASAVANLLAAL